MNKLEEDLRSSLHAVLETFCVHCGTGQGCEHVNPAGSVSHQPAPATVSSGPGKGPNHPHHDHAEEVSAQVLNGGFEQFIANHWNREGDHSAKTGHKGDDGTPPDEMLQNAGDFYHDHGQKELGDLCHKVSGGVPFFNPNRQDRYGNRIGPSEKNLDKLNKLDDKFYHHYDAMKNAGIRPFKTLSQD